LPDWFQGKSNRQSRESKVQQRFGHDVNVDDFRVLLGPLSLDAWQSYRATIQQFMQWLAGNGKTLLEADGRDIATYISYLQGDEHSPASGQCVRYAPSTVYRKVSIIRRLFNVLYQRGLIRRNPAAQVSLPHVDMQKRVQDMHLSVEQVRQLLAAADLGRPIGIRDRALLALMALHGLSVGEVQRLDVSSVDLGDGTLQVLGRCGKPRTVFLTAATNQVIGAWLAVRQLVDAGCPAVFISLQWTMGRAQPGAGLNAGPATGGEWIFADDRRTRNRGQLLHPASHICDAWP
jgi:site-specific recombinase XerD